MAFRSDWLTSERVENTQLQKDSDDGKPEEDPHPQARDANPTAAESQRELGRIGSNTKLVTQYDGWPNQAARGGSR